MIKIVPLTNSKNDGGVRDITSAHFCTNMAFLQTTIQLSG